MTVPSEEENNRKERKNIMIHDEPEILRMSEVQLREVDWLWYPYIPFGKLAILQGDPGEGLSDNAKALLLSLLAGTALDRDASLAALRAEWGFADPDADTTPEAADAADSEA